MVAVSPSTTTFALSRSKRLRWLAARSRFLAQGRLNIRQRSAGLAVPLGRVKRQLPRRISIPYRRAIRPATPPTLLLRQVRVRLVGAFGGLLQPEIEGSRRPKQLREAPRRLRPRRFRGAGTRSARG